MTPKRWLALFAFYISYLLFGASIYYHIENRLEMNKRADDLQQRIEINELLVDHLSTNENITQTDILEKISEYCSKPVTNYTLDEYEEPYRWTFYHSLVFAFTVCSTLGYGNLAPSNTLGQMILIVYSLIGIPINGILFAGLGEFFGRTFTGIYRRYKEYKMANDDKYVPRQFGLFATVIIALVPGITFFIILPSLLFSYFEGWPFTLSLYYSYVTTTTIGFGDYVPTFQSHQEREFGIKFLFYQIFILVWFIFSLGYLLMVMTFITKGLRSKKLANLEKQLSVNIKATQSKIWHGVTKDVGYLRRILNELYIMKFRPVYNEPGDKIPFNLQRRAASCPDLTIYCVTTPILARKRAFSETLEDRMKYEQLGQGTPLVHSSSDTDLDKINKQKTFATAQVFMQTTDLLARVVTALGNIRPPQDDAKSTTSTVMGGGYHGLSDTEILASERTLSGWSLFSNEPPMPPNTQRARACSDFFISPHTIPPNYNEWTWSGDNTQIQEVINNRVKYNKRRDNLYRAALRKPKISSSSSNNSNSVILNIDDEVKEIPKETDSKSFLKKFIPFKKRPSEDFSRRKKSSISIPEFSAPDYTDARQYQRPSISDRRESLFNAPDYTDARQYQRPSISDRRESLFNVQRSNVDRRGSLFSMNNNNDRRGSLFSARNENIDRRGSLFSMSKFGADRRGSLFSVPSQEEIDQDVLENTTIADLIRAIEVIHTHATIQDNLDSQQPKRKNATASPPSLSPLLSLFPQTSSDQPSSGNYSRRGTIFNSLTNQSPTQTVIPRRMSVRPSLDPPPYTEKETPKFKRRFSVRPTNLQTPPGMAPSVNTNKSQSNQPPQTALQRRLSLRPSPLAREMTSPPETTRRSSVFTQQIPIQINLGRSGVGVSSTHSPLSRMAQLQATRKSSLPDVGTLDRSK